MWTAGLPSSDFTRRTMFLKVMFLACLAKIPHEDVFPKLPGSG